MRAVQIGQLSKLRELRLHSTCFDAAGAAELAALGELTSLRLLSCAGVMGPDSLAETLQKVRDFGEGRQSGQERMAWLRLW